MSGLTIAITGHRPQSIDNDFTYQSENWQWIRRELSNIFDKVKPPRINTGMALGVDTVAAEVALGMQIPFLACIPCKGQESKWNKDQQRHYFELLDYADAEVLVTDSDYKPELMQVRNEYMVDNADLVVAVWNGFKGGTRNCVEYALKNQVPVWRIDPKTRRVGRYDGKGIIVRESVVA